ncbi:hypothetical protein [Cerasicoccus arenae]|uniref:DUF115 domain-containing protein n=1 Tax=Cerasicoccus arenae TaxID=424488 RepID=A0A8J3DL95_9BACT|nr:hypothetical protein [Cerasicoccus arenae]MBK1858061.1 hypothetical protein [Cerasicoccus arenae]GHC06825.1 hypothetical protein GCM10007047_24840 [Cerasicoccus arenae]
MQSLRRLYRNIRFLLGADLQLAHNDLRDGLRCALRNQMQPPAEWFTNAKDSKRGQRCFLVGCGPSLNKVDLSRLAGEVVMGVNGTAMIEGLKLDYFVTVSNFFWKSHPEMIRNLKCQRFIPYFLQEELESDSPTAWLNTVADQEYRVLDVEKPWQFSFQPDRYVFLGGTVIFVCLQILYYLGFEEVVVLGLDHDYGIDPNSVPKSGQYVSSDKLGAHFTKNYYRKDEQVHIDIHGMERAYALAETAFRYDGRCVLNASPGTKLDIFEKVEYSTLFSR